MRSITAESLGSAEFKKDYGLRYAYLAGAMYKGIASKELVVAMAKAGMMGYLGTGGMQLQEVDAAIEFIQSQLPTHGAFGMNLLCNLERPELEEQTIDLFLRRNVRNIEAAAFMRITPSLVRWRLTGVTRAADGRTHSPRRILAKVSRPEVAAAFLQPAPEDVVRALLAAGKISPSEAELSRDLPMADDLCIEADSGGHTDQGVAFALLPTMLLLRDEFGSKQSFQRRIRVGAAGGIGTPHAAAAAFVMGADFVLTGSINQCTVEAGTSEAAKDLLQTLNVQDTDYAPAGDMFEIGARVQVAKRGLFFPARANKLYELYQRHASLDDIDAKTRQQIEERYFGRSFDAVWDETKSYYLRERGAEIAEVERNPKRKMALVFRWYFVHTTRLAMQGSERQKVDYQIHCGPAMGALNQWLKGTELESWRRRHAGDIATRIMNGAAELLQSRFEALSVETSPSKGRYAAANA